MLAAGFSLCRSFSAQVNQLGLQPACGAVIVGHRLTSFLFNKTSDICGAIAPFSLRRLNYADLFLLWFHIYNNR